MNTIFTNPEKTKTSKLHVLILDLTDKLHVRRGAKSIAIPNLSI